MSAAGMPTSGPPRRGPPLRLAAGGTERCALLDEIMRSPEAVMVRGRVLKHDGTTTVTAVGDGRRRWVIKRYNTKNRWHAVRRVLQTSRAVKCWRAAGWLAQAGIDTAPPVAALEERRGLWLRGRSYFVCEFVAGETLGQALDQAHGRDSADRLVDQAAGILLRLRDAAIVHGDLKATNFIVAGSRLYLVDLDAARRASGRRLQAGLRRDRERFLRNWAAQPELARRFASRLGAADGH